jgi:hypothetical protein
MIAEHFLVKLRPLAYRFSCSNPAFELDDYVSIGLERVISVVRKTGNSDYGYLYGVARVAMLEASSRDARKYVPAISLDAYLFDGDTDTERYIEDVPPVSTYRVDIAKKRMVNALLATLPEKHRLIIMADFLIQGRVGRIPSKRAIMQKFGLNQKRYCDTKSYALATIRRKASKLQA